MTASAGRIRIGLSGWRYKGWRGSFYPKGLAQRRELEFAAGRFPTLEINGTFYSLQRASSFRRWYDETPADFSFAVKGSRFITHMKRLVDIDTPLANFYASGVLELREKLGPFLWQLPPRQKFDAERLAHFFDRLPRDTIEAAKLARKHDGRVKEASLQPHAKRRLRHAIEVRHESFRDAAFIDLLRRYGIALVFADAPEWPYFEDVTADFLYLRLHGSEELYASGYTGSALDRWGKRVTRWAAGGEPRDAQKIDKTKPKRRRRDVYVYFDNDAKVRAPVDAEGLIGRT